MFDYDPPKDEGPVDYTGFKIVGILSNADLGFAACIVLGMVMLAIKIRWQFRGANMRMRKFAFAVSILFLVLPCSGQPTQGKAKPAIESGKPNYTITITSPNGPLSLKSPLLIEIYFTNTTTSDIYLESQICHLCTTQRILLTKDGKEVETTPFQRMVTGRGLPSDFEELHKQFPHMTAVADGHPWRCGPGVFWKTNLDIRKFYNITEPGQYTITANRGEGTRDEKVVVKSNTVTLDIVP